MPFCLVTASFIELLITFNTEKRKLCPVLYNILQYGNGECIFYCAVRCELAYFYPKPKKVKILIFYTCQCVLIKTKYFVPVKQSLLIKKKSIRNGNNWKKVFDVFYLINVDFKRKFMWVSKEQKRLLF